MWKNICSILTMSLVLSMGSPATAQNTLRVAFDSDPISLDPHEQLSGPTLQMSHMVFDPLIRWTKDLQFEPRLAESWEQIDQKTMRFKLKQGVKFHSGNKLTTADVKWTYNRLKRSIDFKGLFSEIKDLKVIDDYTFDVVTHKRYPLILHTVSTIFPLDSKFYSGKTSDGKDKSEISKHGNSFASRNMSGTGPFIVTKREAGIELIYERFPGYWDRSSEGNIDQLIFTPIKEDSTRISALLAGDVDFVSPVPPTEFSRLENSDTAELVTMPGTRSITFHMNQKSHEAFKDVRVRTAIEYAVNNEAIVQRILRGFGTPAGQSSPKGYFGYNPALKPRYDLERAKQLMAEAGYENGFSITMMAPNNRYVKDDKIAQVVASMLAKINITVNLQVMPKAQYWPKVDARAADMMMIGWRSDTNDSASFHKFLTACTDPESGFGQYNLGYYCNEDADALYHEANSETDPEKRAKLLQELEALLYEDAAFLSLHWQNLAWGVKKGLHHEGVLNPINQLYFGDLVIQ